MFPRKNIYKGTWKAPNSSYTNQIDHVLINTRFKNCLHDIKTGKGADCDSDHYQLKRKLKEKLKKPKVTILDRREVSKLKNHTIYEFLTTTA